MSIYREEAMDVLINPWLGIFFLNVLDLLNVIGNSYKEILLEVLQENLNSQGWAFYKFWTFSMSMLFIVISLEFKHI